MRIYYLGPPPIIRPQIGLRSFGRDVHKLYKNFRTQFPDVANAADAKHIEIWGKADLETISLWFETLANVLNAHMKLPEFRTELATIFIWFDQNFRAGNSDVKRCIDVNLVENLF